MLRASFDRRFRTRLHRDRAGALDTCGIDLSPSERAVLLVISPEQLDAMVEGVARNVIDRRGWFARVAAVFGIFLGAGSLAVSGQGCTFVPACTGIRPESEPPVVTGTRSGAAETGEGAPDRETIVDDS
jgi:hypothetical protein